MGNTGSAVGRRSGGTRDLLVVGAAAVVLFCLGLVFDVYDRAEGRIVLWPHLDELLAITLLAFAGTAIVTLRAARRTTSERGLRHDAEARFRDIVERVPVVAYTWNAADAPGSAPAGYISPQIEALLGYTAEEWLADPEAWGERVDADHVASVLDAWHDAVETQRPFAAEYRIRHADGHWVWVRDEANPVGTTDAGTLLYQGVLVDITARMDAEEALRLSEALTASIVASALDAIVSIDADGIIIEFNPAAEQVFGHRRDDVMGRLLSEVIVPAEHRAAHERGLAHLRETGEGPILGQRLELMAMRADGTEFPAEIAVTRIDVQGRTSFTGFIRDISERRGAEERLRSAQDRYRSLVEQLPVAVYVDAVDDVSTALYISPRYEELTGYSPDQRLADPELWVRMLHPDDRERTLAESDRTNETGDPFDVEYRIVAADGRTVWLHDHAQLVTAGDGSSIWQGVLQDITAEKEAEEHLREAEERYRGIVEHVPAAIYLDLADATMETVYVSPQIRDIAGVTADEWIADPELWLTMMHPEDRDEVRASYLNAAHAGSPWTAEYRLRTPDGRTIWIHDETTVLHGDDGTARYIQGVLFDVTERKLAEQALRESERREREAADRLRSLDEMKNTFLAAVSHELRSPLTSILGLSLTLERARDITMDDREDLLRRLASNARKLDRLLKDLLDIDRLQRGIVEPQYRVTDVGALSRRVLENLDLLAGRDVVAMAEPVVIAVDPPKVERIVENLLTNAARHTATGRRIWLVVQPMDNGVLIAVEDEGRGVDPALRDAIFEPFRQAMTETPHAPGTGIGLSLVARFAELHGGRAWVDDRDGGGSSFRVFLPAHSMGDGASTLDGARPAMGVAEPGYDSAVS